MISYLKVDNGVLVQSNKRFKGENYIIFAKNNDDEFTRLVIVFKINDEFVLNCKRVKSQNMCGISINKGTSKLVSIKCDSESFNEFVTNLVGVINSSDNIEIVNNYEKAMNYAKVLGDMMVKLNDLSVKEQSAI